MTTGRSREIGVKKRQADNDGLRFIQPVFGGARKGRRAAAHLDAGRDRFGDCGMGRSRNEIARWRQGAALRTTADRREGLEIPRRDQHHGFGETNGAGAAASTVSPTSRRRFSSFSRRNRRPICAKAGACSSRASICCMRGQSMSNPPPARRWCTASRNVQRPTLNVQRPRPIRFRSSICRF